MARDVALDAGARPDALIASGLAVPGCGRTPAGVRSRSQPEHYFAGRATLAETRRQCRAASAIVPASASSAASSARPPRP